MARMTGECGLDEGSGVDFRSVDTEGFVVLGWRWKSEGSIPFSCEIGEQRETKIGKLPWGSAVQEPVAC